MSLKAAGSVFEVWMTFKPHTRKVEKTQLGNKPQTPALNFLSWLGHPVPRITNAYGMYIVHIASIGAPTVQLSRTLTPYLDYSDSGGNARILSRR